MSYELTKKTEDVEASISKSSSGDLKQVRNHAILPPQKSFVQPLQEHSRQSPFSIYYY